MPIYEYKCENGHLFEEIQRMSDEPLTTCVQCRAPVQRVFHPVAVHFKGSGFYTTDYGSGKAEAGSGDGESSGSKDGDSKDSTSSSDKSDSGSSEKKSDSSKSDSPVKSSSADD